jgi:hypothetical protein
MTTNQYLIGCNQTNIQQTLLMNFNIFNIDQASSGKGSGLSGQKSFREPCRCAKILIADDEPFNLIALEGFLQCYNVGTVDKVYHGK